MYETKRISYKVFLTISFLIIFSLGIFLRIYNLNNVASRSPDENVYTYQAGMIAQNGLGITKLLVKNYNSNPKMWVYPPPTRIGYLSVLAGVMKLTGKIGMDTGAYISVSASILSLILLVILGLRFLNPVVTFYALLAMSVSPMELAIARRTWQDALLGLCGFLLIYLACEITRNINRIMPYIIFILIGSFSILIKTSGIIIYGLAGMWILWVLVVKKKKILKGILFVLFCTLGSIASAVIIFKTSGGIDPVVQLLCI